MLRFRSLHAPIISVRCRKSHEEPMSMLFLDSAVNGPSFTARACARVNATKLDIRVSLLNSLFFHFFPFLFFSLDSLTIMMKSPTVCHDVMCGLCSGTNAHFGHATPLAPPQFTEFNSIIEKPNLIKGKKKKRMKSLLSDSALHIVRAACTIPLLCCVQMY